MTEAQYAAVSARRVHDVPPARSESYVDDASVVRLPTNVCWCDAPAFPGKTIGSSGAWWLKVQFSMKLTPCRSARDASPIFGFSPANAAGPSNAATTVRTPAAAIRITALTSTSPDGTTKRFPCEVRPVRLAFVERFVTCA